MFARQLFETLNTNPLDISGNQTTPNEPIVGSYSSTKRDRIKHIVTADFPTPPSPRTCILITLLVSITVFPNSQFRPTGDLRGGLSGFNYVCSTRSNPVFCAGASTQGVSQRAIATFFQATTRAQDKLKHRFSVALSRYKIC